MNDDILISFALSVLGILAATLIPAYIALYIVTNLRGVPLKYMAAAGVGVSFWYFFDTMGDASQLDVNSSFSGGLPQIAVVAAFLAGIATLAIFDYFAVPISQKLAAVNQRVIKGGKAAYRPALVFLIPAGVAAVTGIHGLAEGWDFASVASGTSTSSLIDAFGGLSAVASYPFHKFLESMIVGTVYFAWVTSSKQAIKATWHIPVLGLLIGLPSAIGALLGYYVSFDTTYFFAFGVTSALYATIRLVEPMILQQLHPDGDYSPTYLGPGAFAALAIGFFLLYTAALLH